MSRRLVKDEPQTAGKYDELLDALNPVFYRAPAIAFARHYDVLLVMYQTTRTNIKPAFGLIEQYDEKIAVQIEEDENNIDMMADRVSSYLIQISTHISSSVHMEIMDHYYSGITEFERLWDHAMNIAEIAGDMNKKGVTFSENAREELSVLQDLINTIMDYTHDAFEKRELAAARHIKPLEEGVDDMAGVLNDNHLERFREGLCNVYAETEFLNLLSEIERIDFVGALFYDKARKFHSFTNKIHKFHCFTIKSANSARTIPARSRGFSFKVHPILPPLT